MTSVTGIEVGPDTCVLVRVRRGRRGLTLSAVHVIDPSQWPDHDSALTALLRSVRRRHRFPRRARVVFWGLHQSATLGDPAAQAFLRPIVEAGFHVDAIFTPPQALARLAADVTTDRGRPHADAATAWLALNRRGAAIAIVRGGDLLYSRTFDWAYDALSRPHEQLLQRYSLVAHLAPEVRHGMQMVRSAYAVRVDAAVTCGDLPDLRSVTMPLIEELGIEVETLDSTADLELAGGVKTEGLEERGPSVRVACAAAAAPVPRRIRAAALVPAAAALAGIGVLGWWAYTQHAAPARVPRASQGTAARAAAPQTVTPQSGRLAPASPAPARPAPASAATRVPAEERPLPADPAPIAAAPPTPAPAGDTPGLPVRVRPRASWSPRPGLAEPARQGALPPSGGSSETAAPSAETASAPAERPRAARRPATPLSDPVPAVSSILIAAERRLAILDGDIVGEGEAVGRRMVVRIEPSAVVLREPSGHEIRVAVHARSGPGPGSGVRR